MKQVFRYLQKFMQEINFRPDVISVTINCENETTKWCIVKKMNEDMMEDFFNPYLDKTEGVIYNIPFKIKVKK